MSETPKSNRRDFLVGRAAVDALSALGPDLHTADGSAPLPLPDAAESYLVHVSRSAMACEFDVILNAQRPTDERGQGPARALLALELLDSLEDQLSVYRDHSEVSAINRRASYEPVVVEPRLFALLQAALEISSATRGAFDITSSPLSRAWGFWRRAGQLPAPAAVQTALANVGWRHVELEPQSRTIRFSQPGVEINLNAIGKGHALDRCAEFLEGDSESNKDSIHDFIMHGGQSSILARGSRSGYEGWTVSLRNPLRPEQRLAEFCLRNQALGTSGSGTQFFYHAGKRYGHVLDPRTGYPADKVLSATAVAPTAAEADALATAFYVLGWEETESYCAKHDQIGALLVLPGPREGSVDVRSVGIEGV